MTTPDDALLPCPFCDDRNHLESISNGRKGWVSCRTCNAGGPIAVGELRWEAAWNRRAGQAHADGLLEALEAATGYMMNAAISLEAGSNKRSAINTLNSGIERARAAIAAAKGADQ